MRRAGPKTKEKLADMIEMAVEERLEEILEYAEKHHLCYSLDIKIWRAGEAEPK